MASKTRRNVTRCMRCRRLWERGDERAHLDDHYGIICSACASELSTRFVYPNGEPIRREGQ